MDTNSDMVCVILAGGQGKRMGSTGKHKVCFPIAGRPAIVRAIDTYKAAGLRRFLVVVGQMAGQVIATVSAAHPEVTFVHQPQSRGTGHAALMAADALAAQHYRGGVMIVMGDKVSRMEVIRNLMNRYYDGAADVVLTSLPKAPATTAGRIVTDSKGKIIGVVELADIKNASKSGKKLSLSGRKLSAASLEKRSVSVNASMYAFRFAALQEALGQLNSDNAQGELYLTDTIEYLAQNHRVEQMHLTDATDLMAFNTPAELLAIEEVISRREKPPRISQLTRKRLTSRMLKPAAEWLKIFDGDSPKLRSALVRCYGNDPVLLGDRIKTMKRLALAFVKRYGPDRPMLLCRAPGRLNLMGRHVDHRGGYVNVMAISRETLLAAAPREDDVVSLRNLQAKQFPPRQFSIYELLRDAGWSDWLDFLASQTASQVLQTARGDWSHYARAPLLRLQHECRTVRLKGMDCLITGNIPMGAGLSSSSAMVVAFAEAAVALNRLDVALHDFIDLCGEGEWFVGSRGGSADHAAIRTGKRGHISKIGFFPFRLEGDFRFPSNLSVVIAHSGSQAVKSKGAKDIFNQRVACYELSTMLLRRLWPAAAGLKHLRDLSPERLKVKSGEIYRALTLLPQRPTRKQLRKLLPPEDHSRLEEIFATHADLGGYDLRGAALYGISECLRSEKFAKLVAARDLNGIGQLMRISHDGDRKSRLDASGKNLHKVKMDDQTLEHLADTNANIIHQCGRYSCSTKDIDQLVDIANDCKGVVGAQLAGAGLGGCIMILVHTKDLSNLTRRLRKEYYQPRSLTPNAHACTPVAGASLLSVQE